MNCQPKSSNFCSRCSWISTMFRVAGKRRFVVVQRPVGGGVVLLFSPFYRLFGVPLFKALYWFMNGLLFMYNKLYPDVQMAGWADSFLEEHLPPCLLLIIPNTFFFKRYKQACCAGCRRRPSPVEAPPIGKIHPFSKMAVTFEPVIKFWCPSGFRKFLITMTYSNLHPSLTV